MDDDIEILDIFNKDKKPEAPVARMSRLEKNEKLALEIEGNQKKGEYKDRLEKRRDKQEEKDIKKEKKKKKEKKVKEVKPTSKKVFAFQLVFCIFSALFILGCIGYYGYRFVKYYRIYNPKVESGDGSVLLAKDIVGKSEFGTDDEDGLFSSSGNYIYKGNVTNNYLKYNNMIWRIVRINADNSIDIILDDYMTLLPWGSKIVSFKESDIYNYLNKDFLELLDVEMLNKTSFCTDKLEGLTSITCNDQNSDGYIKLLDVANFLNSVNNGKSYLVSDDEIFWLADYNNDKIWHTNGVNVSQSDVNTFYEVRPMVRLKSTTVYREGDGTKEKPFMVGREDELKVGSKVVLDEDTWIVYENKDNVRLMKESLLEKQIDFDKEKLTYKDSNIMTYLNETYLDSLTYKDMIMENTWYIGEYKDNISDIKKDTVKAKVGIPNMLDYKFDSSVKSYFTSTISDERVMVYENPIRPGKITTYRSIRPCITISKENASKLVYSDGVFKVGV